MDTSSIAFRNRACKRSATQEENQHDETKRLKIDSDEENSKEDFCINKLLEMMLDCVIRLKQIPVEDITRSISYIISQFRYGPEQFSCVNLKKWENNCGYFFRYGLHGASLTRVKVLEAIQSEKCKDLRSSLKKKVFRVISLGGGGGNDVIGLCSALQSFQIRSNQIHVTVVDAVQEWALYVNLANSIISEGGFGKVSELFNSKNVDLSFLKVQLPGNGKLDKKYFQKLAKADIILITKLLSTMDENEKKDIIKSLHKEIKNEAFILVIDSPFLPKFWNGFDVLYVSRMCEHESSVKVEKFQSNNSIVSKARIAVLRKKKDPRSDLSNDTFCSNN